MGGLLQVISIQQIYFDVNLTGARSRVLAPTQFYREEELRAVPDMDIEIFYHLTNKYMLHRTFPIYLRIYLESYIL